MTNIIHSFENIRDIPYSIPLSIGAVDNCCSGKMKRLKAVLENAGYTTKYRICSFRWSDMDLPEKVTSVRHADNSTHVYLEVLVDGEWINVDPTWDPGIAAILATAHWDGKNSTSIAVKALSLFSDGESRKIMEGGTEEETLDDLAIN